MSSPATIDALRELRTLYPDTPFLTLGQTVLWDEPAKAALCLLCETLQKNGDIAGVPRFVAGVHDTDYFAKLEGLSVRDEPFVVLRHNDGDTRGLWSAAGELSALFGAEIVPSRSDLTRAGASFSKAARAYRGGREALLNQETEAPLWRAVVHTENHSLISADVKLHSILPALRQQLHWGFRQTLVSTGCSPDFENQEPCPSRDVARKILSWLETFARHNESATLSDFYRDLIPKIWMLSRGEPSCDLETTTSVALFRFNPQTAHRPRFRFLDLFLNPASREIARKAYNDAVRSSGIYTLDGFGEGALPFDVVIPGRGRGTLRFHDKKVVIETEEPIEICHECDPEGVAQLAALLHAHFGDEVAVVGKAVSLISMLAAEFIFVFHEKASSYTARTQKMNAALRQAGIELWLHPMLRLGHATWDALDGCEGTFTLPAHLAGAFGTEKISVSEFSARWRAVAQSQTVQLERLRLARAPRDLMAVLAEFRGEIWREKAAAWVGARGALQMLHEQTAPLRAQIGEKSRQIESGAARLQLLQREKGEFFRSHILPLQRRAADIRQESAARVPFGKASRQERQILAESEAKELEMLKAQLETSYPQWQAQSVPIEELKNQVRHQRAVRTALLNRLLQEQKSQVTRQVRQQLEALENEAELARLLLLRDAIRARDCLLLTHYRPTAWWIPVVSPDGRWFRQMSEKLEARLESL